jgi:hypothetical protein
MLTICKELLGNNVRPWQWESGARASGGWRASSFAQKLAIRQCFELLSLQNAAKQISYG